MMAAKVGPLSEIVEPEVFTNRTKELERLYQWAEFAARGGGHSRALIGQRRLGKSVILRKFYNHVFWGPRRDVIPFYFEIKNKPQWLFDFASDYFTQFLKQYLAFKLQLPSLIEEKLEVSELIPYVEKLDGEAAELIKKHIPIFERRQQEKRGTYLWDFVMDIPEILAWCTREHIIVIIDEFQRIDEVLCYDENLKMKARPLSGGFSHLSESLEAPMLVAGSAVTIMSRRTLGGGLNGRFTQTMLEPLSIEDGVELAMKLASYFGVDINLKTAYQISQTAGGNPFYIRAVLTSTKEDKALTTTRGVADTFDYEVRKGEIHKFWSEHFEQNAKKLGGDEAKRIIFCILKWEGENEESVKERQGGLLPEEISKALSLPVERIEKKLKLLSEADVVERVTSISYRGLKDQMLSRVLRLEYERRIREVSQELIAAEVEQELRAKITQLEREKRSLQGKLNDIIGRKAEVVIERLMKWKFNNQKVDGNRFFHIGEEILLPKMERVRSLRVQAEGTEGYQIDNFGEPLDSSHAYWVTEQKQWDQPLPTSEVEKFIRAISDLKQDRQIGNVVGWLYARSGFTEEAEALLRQEGILYSDASDLQRLAEELGFIGL